MLIKSAVLENNELYLFGMWEQSELQHIKVNDRQITKDWYVTWSVSTGLGICRIQF